MATTISGTTGADKVTTSAVAVAMNATGSAPIYACRAWVNFDGTGTVAIRASGNVSSITDNGVGDYTVNFATAMPDANYAFLGAAGLVGANALMELSATSPTPTLSSQRIDTINAAGAVVDASYINIAVLR